MSPMSRACHPQGKLNLVTIQFPDPHVKKKHGKRRIVQKQLVEAIGRHLVPGGRLFLQSDMEKVREHPMDPETRHMEAMMCCAVTAVINIAPPGLLTARICLSGECCRSDLQVVADMRDNFERHGGDLFEIAPEHLAGPCSR